MPLWTDVLAADTDHLSHEEYGLYQRMLNVAWRTPTCDLPNDPAWLMRRFRLSPDQFESLCQPIIVEFWHVNARKRLEQKRQKKERAYVEKKTQKSASAAKLRWNKEKRVCERNAPTPTPTPTLKETTKNPASRSKYAFEYGCVKLNAEHLEMWETSFGRVDVKAELISMEPWAKGQNSWFNACAGRLAKLNRQARAPEIPEKEPEWDGTLY